MAKEKPKIQSTLDGIDGFYIGGWAWNPDNPEKRLEVVLYVDGEPVAEEVADLYREDIEKAGIGNGKYGFKIRLPNEIFDSKEHEIRVFTKDKIELKHSPIKKVFSSIICVVEKVTPQFISGFAIDMLNPFKSLTVNLIIGGKVVAKTLCSILRDDVPTILSLQLDESNLFLPALPCGFKIFIPDEIIRRIDPSKKVELIPIKLKIGELEFIPEDKINLEFLLKGESQTLIIAKKRVYEDELEIEESLTEKRDIKPIAFYLPQFYPFPENNEWWGEGFTEWTQLTQSKPLFDGHYQPRIPADLGYYDLRLRDVRKRQEELAKEYGIYGFCYYYYWFSGKTLMDEIVRDILESGIPDLPFCLCWANEPWTRRWDGQDKEVLMPQLHDPEIDERFVIDIMPYLKDRRYIKVEGKPLVIVYNVGRIPDSQKLFQRWRLQAKEEGLPDLYIVIAQTFGVKEPYPYGADAAVEFPPHQAISPEITKELIKPEESKFSGHIFDYREVVAREITKTEFLYPLYRTVMTGWDNSPRRGLSGHIFHYASPEYYEIWLRHLIDYSRSHLPEDRRFIFINAWNEWAEGTYLEPDRYYGRSYLQATKRALHDRYELDSALKEIKLYKKNNPSLEKPLTFINDYVRALKKTYSIISYNMKGILEFNNKISTSVPFKGKTIDIRKKIGHESQYLKYNIDRINQFVLPSGIIRTDSTNLLEIVGWLALLQKRENYFYILFFDDENNQSFIFTIKNRFPRQDVNSNLNIDSNFLSGFNAYLDLKEIPEGDYNLCLLCTDENNNYFIEQTKIRIILNTMRGDNE